MTTHRYNPLFYIRRDAVYRFGDLDKIGGILFPTTGGDNDTWSQQSKNVFMRPGVVSAGYRAGKTTK